MSRLRSHFLIGIVVAAAFVGGPSRAFAQTTPAAFSDCKNAAGLDTYSRRSLDLVPTRIPERGNAIRWTASGTPTDPVVLICNDTTLEADRIVYDDDTQQIVATGNVLLLQKDLRIYAARAEMNGKTKLGTFYEANGAAKLGDQPAEKSLFGTMEPDIYFYGEVLAKIGPQKYRITHGEFTTCVQPTPRWVMTGSQGTITLDKRVLMTNVVLKVKDVPLFYLPMIYYPIDKGGRSTGFLLPTYTADAIRGSGLSNAFFWAINRSQDATFYHDWSSKTGQGFGSEYRYISAPGSSGNAKFDMLNEKTRYLSDGVTVERAGHRSYDIEGRANQALPHGFRLIGSMKYFTDATTQELYQQNVYDYSQRQRYFQTSLSGSAGPARISATYNRNDIFYGATSTAARYGSAPGINVAIADKPIKRSKVYFGASGDLSYLLKQTDIADPLTDTSLWRFDGGPTIRAGLSSLSFLSVNTSASWRVTRWFESLDPTEGSQVPVGVTRQIFDLRARVVGPVMARVFQTPENGYAERFKHLIEPSFGIQWTSPFENFSRVVFNDYSDGIVGGTTQLSYGLTNRIMARRRAPAVPGAATAATAAAPAAALPTSAAPGTAAAPAAVPAPPPGIVRDILSVEISQSYYTDARASKFDTQYESSLSNDAKESNFSPLKLTVSAKPTDTILADLRMEFDPKYRSLSNVSASGSVVSPLSRASVGWSKQQQFSLVGVSSPSVHTLFSDVTLRTRANSVGGTYSIYLDILNRNLQQQRIAGYYNSQCCGVSFEYLVRKTFLSSVPTNRTFALSFTLAGIGSFANPFGSFGGR